MKRTNFNLASPPGIEKWIDFQEKRGQKGPFSAVREQLFHLEHTVEIFGDRDKLVAIGIQIASLSSFIA